MTTPMTVPHKGSWLEGFKRLLCRVFWKDRACPLVEDHRPITTEQAVDQASEDSFPASDPPSFTGSIT